MTLAPSGIINEALNLVEDTLLDLFIIDGSAVFPGAGPAIQYLVSPEQSGSQTIEYVDDGGTLRTYLPVPISATGFELTGSNRLPSPSLTIANVNRAFTILSESYDDLLGFRFVRLSTYAKFVRRIGGGTVQSSYDASAHHAPDEWYINRKVEETKLTITWELASVFDNEGLTIPRRRIYANYCPFVYRGPECQWAGAEPTGETTCNKSLEACERRFGNAGLRLRFGGFPTAQV
jgi:lambda family phage minor tail protein L